MRYFLHIGYKGTNYHGWQNQADAVSIQQMLETNMSKLLAEKINCHGCGRTDAGVHAGQYFLHFETAKEPGQDFVFTMNKLLPDDIAVFEIIPVHDGANAQLDAIARTYDYFIHFRKDPFLAEVSALYQLENMDFEKMKAAVSLFTKYRDFSAFCLSPKQHRSTICEVSEASILLSEDGERLRFRITADRFLKGMIRTIVARLLEIGKGKLLVSDLENALRGMQSLPFAKIAWPQGLHLAKVEYPYLNIPSKSPLSDMLNQGFGK